MKSTKAESPSLPGTVALLGSSGPAAGAGPPAAGNTGESVSPVSAPAVQADPLVPSVPTATVPGSQTLPSGSDSLKALSPFPGDTANAVPPSGDVNGDKLKAPREVRFRLGAQYTAEWMFNTLEGEKFLNHAGVEGCLVYRRFSVTTGAIFSVGKGSNELVVDYNDYLGSYNDLDSISFDWDGNHTALVPTYYMTPTDVWDSLLETNYSKVVKRYTYLEVPLILGYDFWQPGRFSFGLRAGPVMAILLGSKQVSTAYDPGKDRVIQVNEITPDRINLNWQVTAGLSVGYRISRRTFLDLEPMFRYYFNSVYEKPGLTTKPWSIGIRAAFYFDFYQ